MPGGEVQRWAQAEGWLQVFANHATILVGEAVHIWNITRGTRMLRSLRTWCSNVASSVRTGFRATPTASQNA